MAKKATHCDLCPQVKPRLIADQIVVVVDGYEYPVNVCDRHRAVLKNMFLGVIPASAFGDVAAKPITRKAIASKTGQVKAAKKTTSAKKTTAKKATRKTPVRAAAKKATKAAPGRAKKATRG